MTWMKLSYPLHTVYWPDSRVQDPVEREELFYDIQPTCRRIFSSSALTHRRPKFPSLLETTNLDSKTFAVWYVGLASWPSFDIRRSEREGSGHLDVTGHTNFYPLRLKCEKFVFKRRQSTCMLYGSGYQRLWSCDLLWNFSNIPCTSKIDVLEIHVHRNLLGSHYESTAILGRYT